MVKTRRRSSRPIRNHQVIRLRLEVGLRAPSRPISDVYMQDNSDPALYPGRTNGRHDSLYDPGQ